MKKCLNGEEYFIKCLLDNAALAHRNEMLFSPEENHWLHATKHVGGKSLSPKVFSISTLCHIQPLSLHLEMETGLLGNLCPSNLFQCYSTF